MRDGVTGWASRRRHVEAIKYAAPHRRNGAGAGGPPARAARDSNGRVPKEAGTSRPRGGAEGPAARRQRGRRGAIGARRGAAAPPPPPSGPNAANLTTRIRNHPLDVASRPSRSARPPRVTQRNSRHRARAFCVRVVDVGALKRGQLSVSPTHQAVIFGDIAENGRSRGSPSVTFTSPEGSGSSSRLIGVLGLLT